MGSSTFTESGAFSAGSGRSAEFGGSRGLCGDIGYRYRHG
jgi:hypothetical protein